MVRRIRRSLLHGGTASKRDHIAEHYPFERFEERALFLESLVKPGGVLVIHNATYRFSNASYRCAYETIPVAADYDKVYLPDGITEAKPDGCIFRKLKPDRHDGLALKPDQVAASING